MNIKGQSKADKLEHDLQILVLQSVLSPVLILAARTESLYGSGKPSRISGLKLV